MSTVTLENKTILGIGVDTEIASNIVKRIYQVSFWRELI